MDSLDTKQSKNKQQPFHPLVKKPDAPLAAAGALAGSFGASALVSEGIISATTGLFLQLGISVGAALALRALVKPPSQDLITGGTNSMYQGVRNAARPYQPCQQVLGRMRVYPPLAADNYSENRGTDVWARMLFHIGDGEYAVAIDTLKSGDTLLSDLLTDYDNDVEIAVGNISDSAIQEIYPAGVSTDHSLPIELDYDEGWYVRTTKPDTNEISVDVGCLSGLYSIDDDGDYNGLFIFYKIQYRLSNSSDAWTNFPGMSLPEFYKFGGTLTRTYQFHTSAKTQDAITWNHRVTGLASGTYDVRIKKMYDAKLMPYKGNYEILQDDLYWTAFRSINTDTEVVIDPNAYLLALLIKITGNFNGQVDAVSVVATRKCSKYDGAAWTSKSITTNAAWAYGEILRSFVDDSKIDGSAIASWAANCAANGFSFNAIIENETTAKGILENIAAVGRASRAIIDGVHTVVEDLSQSTDVQHFSPRNSYDFNGHREFIDFPHGLKCRFVNENSDYQVDEIIVYDDGYFESTPSADTWQSKTYYQVDDYVIPTAPDGYYYKCTQNGISGTSEPSWPATPRGIVTDDEETLDPVTWICCDEATDFESMQLFGVTNTDHVWKLARYYMAVARLRPETFTIMTDAENLRCTRGDRVGLTYDVMMAGQGQARILEVNGNSVRMDDTITMTGGTDYAAIIRKADFTFLSTTIVNDPGEQSVITLGSVTDIAPPDLIFFGESGSIKETCIVTGIEYQSNQGAKITLTNYNESIYDADTGTIPNFTPVISRDASFGRRPPNVVISDVTLGYWPVEPNDLSQRKLYAKISFYLGMSTDVEVAFFQAQYRETGSTDDPNVGSYSNEWISAGYVPFESRTIMVPVVQNTIYDFRIRTVSLYGVTGNWVYHNDYTATYTGWTPNDIVALQLVGGGSTWSGLDCAITWEKPTDLWRVQVVMVQVLRTDLTQVLRTDYIWYDKNTYVYTYGMNQEDTGGNPVGSLTFRVGAYSISGTAGLVSEKSYTHAAPDAPTGLTYKSQAGGVEFFWDENRQPSFSHFEISISVGVDFDW